LIFLFYFILFYYILFYLFLFLFLFLFFTTFNTDFEESEQYFDKIIKKDPYTLENMDIFSHVLYVTEKTTKLSYLAHNCCMIDKYRQETCCIIGNYYSLRGEHEKAVLYFQRALKLNKNYLSAWTLMGHEYIELKNTQAAIEAYRKAIGIYFFIY